MSLRAVLLGVAVLLAACTSMGPKSGDEPEKIRTQSEVIHDVGADAADAPSPRMTASSPRKALPGDTPRDLAQGPRTEAATAPERAANTRRAAAPAATGELMAPMAGRVGIMSLLGNELSHVHAGTFGGHRKDYNVQYDFNGQVIEELRKALLVGTPYQPVMVASTGALRQAATTWQTSGGSGPGFAPALQREFDGIIKQNRLAMLIVISYASISDGQLIGGRALSGSGLYTRGGLGGTKTAVFSTLQFYRLVGEPARLVRPVAPDDDRSIGDLPNVKLPDDLEDLPPRYLVPVYGPLRTIVQNKIAGLISLPRKLGH